MIRISLIICNVDAIVARIHALYQFATGYTHTERDREWEGEREGASEREIHCSKAQTMFRNDTDKFNYSKRNTYVHCTYQ